MLLACTVPVFLTAGASAVAGDDFLVAAGLFFVGAFGGPMVWLVICWVRFNGIERDPSPGDRQLSRPGGP